MKPALALTLLAALLAAPALPAGPINPLFVTADPANPQARLEFRTGKPGAADWEIGLGRNTQVAGQFQKAEGPHANYWAVGTDYAFHYSIGPDLVGRFSLGGITLSWADMALGNTLQIHAKRDVAVTIGALTLTGSPTDPYGADYGYLPIDPREGFSITGTVRFSALGPGGSMQ